MLRILVLLLLPAMLIVAGFTLLKNDRAMQSVLGTAVSAYRTGTVTWKPVPGTAGYNIYYKQQSDKKYLHAVSNIPASQTQYTIGYLKKNTAYQYLIKALDASGTEFWTSKQMWISNFK